MSINNDEGRHDDGSQKPVGESISLLTYQVAGCIGKIKEFLTGKEVDSDLVDQFEYLENNLKNFVKSEKSGFDAVALRKIAKNIWVHSSAIYRMLKKRSDQDGLSVLLEDLEGFNAKLSKNVDNISVVYDPKLNSVENLRNHVDHDGSSLKKENSELRKQVERYKQDLSNMSRRANDLDEKLRVLESIVGEKLGEANKIYEAGVASIKVKEGEISDLLGMASSNVITDRYEGSAASEGEMADYMRFFSIILMLCTAAVVAYAFHETSSPDFKWETSLFRLIFAVFLSVPAAYLAKESTKHRAQQYAYLQTSLDLKAITPYIASLPIEDQHKLKLDVANRLFASKNNDFLTKDSYPINAHEVLVEFLKKLDSSSKKLNDSAKTG